MAEKKVTEPQRDEHGCIIGKEVFDFSIGQCVPTPPTAKVEFLGEAREISKQNRLPPAWRKKK